MHKHRAILKAIGPYAETATAMGVSRKAVINWSVRGIPPRHWLRIVALAKQKGLEISFDQLAESGNE